jgi:hypothetical protein
VINMVQLSDGEKLIALMLADIMQANEIRGEIDPAFVKEEIVACEAIGVTPYVPKPLTSGAKADGRFGKQDFVYNAGQDNTAVSLARCSPGA